MIKKKITKIFKINNFSKYYLKFKRKYISYNY